MLSVSYLLDGMRSSYAIREAVHASKLYYVKLVNECASAEANKLMLELSNTTPNIQRLVDSVNKLEEYVDLIVYLEEMS